MRSKTGRRIKQENDKGIIEMAAEQFAILLWKQWRCNKDLKMSNSRQRNFLYRGIGLFKQKN